MHCLAGTFIEEKPDVEEDGKTYYPIKIVLGRTKARVIFFNDEKVREEWLEVLKLASGYSNLFDFYDVGDDIASGQFGVVKSATHKKTAKKVAIKSIKKKDMKDREI